MKTEKKKKDVRGEFSIETKLSIETFPIFEMTIDHLLIHHITSWEFL